MILEIIKNLHLEEGTILKEGTEDGLFVVVEGVSTDSSNEERYLIYDCSEKDTEFEFKKYKEKMKEEEGVASPIFIFKTWEQEQYKKEKAYKELKKAADKKLLLQFFEKQQAYYTDLSDEVELTVDERGENYLQYDRAIEEDELLRRYINGKIYNISLAELKKLFNVTGKGLFKKNVREGITNNVTGKELKRKFKGYIKSGAYYEWVNKVPSDKENEDIKRLFDISPDSILTKPDYFWFYHNGITIFCYGKQKIDFSGRHIRLDPRELSVINGAQTMTNYYEGWIELKKEFDIACKEEIEDDSKREKLNEFFEEFLETVNEKMIVKTILVDGDERFVKPVTHGLNTQIPIFETDIITNSDKVEFINNQLKRIGITITKSGQTAPYGKSVSLLSFVKNYVLALGKPGESKNLNKIKLGKYIEEIKDSLEKDPAPLLESLEMVYAIEDFWVQNKKSIYYTYDDKGERMYCSNGKNYFISFVINEQDYERDILDDDFLWILLDRYIKTFIEIKPNPEINDFKSDELFTLYLERPQRQLEDLERILITKEDCEGLKDYLNGITVSHYAVRKQIMDYLNEKGKQLSYFRVISKLNGVVKEAFPFPNSTFNQVVHFYGPEAVETDSGPSFNESEFAKEIRGERSVFVIDWIEDGDRRKVADIKFIDKFSFGRYEEQAEIVYERTISAFENGDETSFPKVSEGICFHVRTKAVDADDTFEFTNGKHITKRTFWANRETVNMILEESI